MKPLFIVGAGDRGRTGMPSRALDFESSASTNFTTPASVGIISKASHPVKQEIPDVSFRPVYYKR